MQKPDPNNDTRRFGRPSKRKAYRHLSHWELAKIESVDDLISECVEHEFDYIELDDLDLDEPHDRMLAETALARDRARGIQHPKIETELTYHQRQYRASLENTGAIEHSE